MAFEFGNLHVMRRGKDLFYSFLEARKTLFSTFSDEYLNNCIRALNLERLTCNDSETSFIQSFLPAEIGPFWLISEGNLMRLHRFLLNSRHEACQSANFGFRFSPFPKYKSVQFFCKTVNLAPGISKGKIRK